MEKFYIYKITNLINSKCYIGSTKRPFQRKKEHLEAAQQEKNPSYNYPLQKAIRKYGKENFLFEILHETSIVEEVPFLEQEYIKKYNSLVNNGYNQTLYTNCALRDPNLIKQMVLRTSKICALVDKNKNIIETYTSYHDAGRKHGYDAKIISKVCNGLQEYVNHKLFRNIDNDNNILEPEIQFTLRVAQIDLKSKQIIKIFKDKRTAAIEVTGKESNRGSILKCIQGSTKYAIVGGYIWREVDVYDNIIQNNIPLDNIKTQAKVILKIDPTTNKIVNTYSSQTKAAKENNMAPATLIKYLNKDIFREFLWKEE